MIEDLKKKKLFIFGGLGLIGKNIGKNLTKYFKKVIIIDIKKKKKKNYFFFNSSNVNKKKSIDTQIQNLINQYGYPDVLINTSYPRSNDWSKISFHNINYNQIIENLDLHLSTYIYLNIKFAQLMKKKNIKGSIINFSSIYGIRPQDYEIYKKTSKHVNPIYSSIKSAINMNVRQIASFYGSSNIRCNSICPGGVMDKSITRDKIFMKKY